MCLGQEGLFSLQWGPAQPLRGWVGFPTLKDTCLLLHASQVGRPTDPQTHTTGLQFRPARSLMSVPLQSRVALAEIPRLLAQPT